MTTERGTARPRTSTALATLGAVGVLLLSACGEDAEVQAVAAPPAAPSVPATPSAPSPAPTPSTSAAVPPAAAPVTVPMTDIELTGTADDGQQVRATLRLSGLMAATDPQLQAAWAGVGGSGPLPCDLDPQRDAAFVGTVQFDNLSPGFTPDLTFSAVLPLDRGSFGFETSSGGKCESRLRPTWQDASWGPVPVTVWIPDYYTPAAPQGDPEALTEMELALLREDGTSPYYDLTFTEGPWFSHDLVGVVWVELGALR